MADNVRPALPHMQIYDNGQHNSPRQTPPVRETLSESAQLVNRSVGVPPVRVRVLPSMGVLVVNSRSADEFRNR